MPEPQGHNAERINLGSNPARQTGNPSITPSANGDGRHSSSQNGATPDFDAVPASPSEVRSFEILFRTYRIRLCAFARGYVKRRDVAEELVEDVFLHMWEHRGTWPDPGNQKQYLYTAVRNQALKYLAHESVVRRLHAIVQENGRVPGMSQSSGTADDELQATELAAAIQQTIDQLPARCRQAYTLSREHGMSYAEVAARMGISVRTVETQLTRANKALHRRLAAWIC